MRADRQGRQDARAIPGLGDKTAAALIALMPELGSLDRRKAAALAGLAPIPNKAATPKATAGHAAEDPRSNASSSWPPSPPANTIQTSKPSTNASSAGKKPLVAITAIMRKLIVIANAKLKSATVQQLS